MQYNYLTSGGAISLTLGGGGELGHFSGIFLYGNPGGTGTGPASAPLSQPKLANERVTSFKSI